MPEPKKLSIRPVHNGSGVIVAREARLHPRVPARLEARISTLDALEEGAKGERYFVLSAATTLDVGDGGVGLECDSLMEPGRRVVVEVDLGDGLSVERNGRVVWAVQDAGGTNFIGVMFDEEFAGLALGAQKSLS